MRQSISSPFFLPGVVNTFLFVYIIVLSTPAEKNDASPHNSVTNKLSTSILLFNHRSFNFGTVSIKQKLTHHFPFRVKGSESLAIQRTTASCGCTIIQYPKGSLAPGDTGSLSVEYITTFTEEAFTRDFTVFSNSRFMPAIQLTILGNAQKNVWTVPPIIDLEDMQAGSPESLLIQVFWKRPENPMFSSVNIPTYLTTGSLIKNNIDTTLWELPVYSAPDATTEYHADSISIKTASPLWPVVAIPIDGRMKPTLYVKPDSLNLDVIKKGTIVSGSVMVFSSNPIDSITASISPENTIRVSQAIRVSPYKYRVVVQNDVKTTDEGSIKVRLTVALQFENGERKEVEVPVGGGGGDGGCSKFKEN